MGFAGSPVGMVEKQWRRIGASRYVRAVLAQNPSLKPHVRRPERVPHHVRTRDWTVGLALGMGITSLVIMFLLFWL
jgi:hypothetical protein